MESGSEVDSDSLDGCISARSEKYENLGIQVVLPGHGDSSPDCGEIIKFQCNKCGAVFDVESSCMMRECPRCYQKWASKEAKESSARYWMGSRLLSRSEGRDWRTRRILHVVISFRDLGEDLHDLRSRARMIAKNHGVVGGCMIEHPWRKGEDNQYVPDGYIHFHVFSLVFGDLKPGSEFEPWGAIFKVVPDARRNDFNGFRKARELRDAIRYALTHAGIRKGRHALTWFGELSYNMMSNKRLDDAFPGVLDRVKSWERKCPRCGSTDVEELEGWDYTSWVERRWVVKYAGGHPERRERSSRLNKELVREPSSALR